MVQNADIKTPDEKPVRLSSEKLDRQTTTIFEEYLGNFSKVDVSSIQKTCTVLTFEPRCMFVVVDELCRELVAQLVGESAPGLCPVLQVESHLTHYLYQYHTACVCSLVLSY